jgi:hypothetical protein
LTIDILAFTKSLGHAIELRARYSLAGFRFSLTDCWRRDRIEAACSKAEPGESHGAANARGDRWQEQPHFVPTNSDWSRETPDTE